MKKQRIMAIEYLRGISMLGVVGIHTAAYSLSNPDTNVHLFALLEIATRFSIPAFFFISAFGLFYTQDINKPIQYSGFLAKRGRGVLIPYVLWSVLYMLHYTWVSGDIEIWSSPLVFEYFLFGLASYQLYFLVILMWFYALLPLWRLAVKWICHNLARNLAILLVLQILFNYYSSYVLNPVSDNYYINLALQYRLSYLVLHYIFIFLLGAVCAVKLELFHDFISRRRQWLTYGFCGTLVGMLGHYYLLLYQADYSPEAAVNTVHQLSPLGVLYTVAAILFWYAVFFRPANGSIGTLFGCLGRYSFPVYLVHPFVMYYLSDYFAVQGLVMNVHMTLLFLLLTVIFSIAFGVFTYRAAAILPGLCELLTGARYKP